MFVKQPHFSVSEKGKWMLTESLEYYSILLNETITVPKGFETDLASIPLFFRSVLPVNGNHRLPAVLHDYFYSLKGKLPSSKPISRRMADKVFLEAMKLSKVGFWKRQAMYRAVRFGGRLYWTT